MVSFLLIFEFTLTQHFLEAWECGLMILLHSWLWASHFYDGVFDARHLRLLGLPISTVTGWLTQQDTSFMCIWYFEFRTPSSPSSQPNDADVCTCLWFSVQVCWLSHPPLFFCVFAHPLQACASNVLFLVFDLIIVSSRLWVLDWYCATTVDWTKCL